MMTIEDYALDVGKTIDEIKALCDKIGINYEDEKTPLDETDIILLDNELQDDEEVAEEIRRRLDMTKVGRIIYEEKIAYGKEVEARVTKEVTKKVTERVTASQTEKAIAVIAELCKEMGASITDVVEQIALKFGLSEDEARKKVEAHW